jgi:hypothetical protein
MPDKVLQNRVLLVKSAHFQAQPHATTLQFLHKASQVCIGDDASNLIVDVSPLFPSMIRLL